VLDTETEVLTVGLLPEGPLQLSEKVAAAASAAVL
jgi:hypothetical protein